LKQLVGLACSNSHLQKTISNHIHFCLSAFTICHQFSRAIKETFFNTVKFLQEQKTEKLKELIYPIWKKFGKILVITTQT